MAIGIYTKRSVESILAVKFDINDSNSLKEIKEFVENNTQYLVHFNHVHIDSTNIDDYYIMLIEDRFNDVSSMSIRNGDYVVINSKSTISQNLPYIIDGEAFENLYIEVTGK